MDYYVEDDRMRLMPTKPRSLRFVCADCGQNRLGATRNQCAVCGEFICDICERAHPKQHPVETKRHYSF